MEPLSFGQRFALAFALFFRVLFDGTLAARVRRTALTEGEANPATDGEVKPVAEAPQRDPLASALQLLALLQREGRLIDFLEQDIAAYSDADVGAGARVMHAGCRKALHKHATVLPIRSEEEDTRVTVDTSGPEITLTGRVSGQGPYQGTLRHRGWKVARLELAETVAGHDARILAPAEVEMA